jgi:indolepyruvate ferredoxin oxidoreductase
MTGGQSPTGARTVAELLAGLRAERVGRMIVTTEDTDRYHGVRLPAGVEVWDRERLVEAQEELAREPGVTVLLHDQQCAAELRRDRKRGRAPVPTARLFIDPRVCEGCGDCGAKSACLSLRPIETFFGTRTEIHQASCNLDRSCIDGDCPSFVLVTPKAGAARSERPRPQPPTGIPDAAPRDVDEVTIRMPGIGGTGVVTIAQVLGTAATLDGWSVDGLDQTGLSQKAGPVVSELRLARGDAPRSGKPAGDAGVDVVLAFDLLVAVAPDQLAGVDPGHTRAVASTALAPTGMVIANRTAQMPDPGALRDAFAAATSEAFFVDAEVLAERLVGSAETANVLLLGIAHQLGLIPVSAASIERALELNGVAVDANLAAFRWGRARVATPDSLPAGAAPPDDPRTMPLDALIERLADDLERYQNRKYARRFLAVVDETRARGSAELTRAVARNLHRLMAYKDEYEVAALHLAASDAAPDEERVLLLHPPVLAALGVKHKVKFGPRTRPALQALAAGRRLRGTRLDPFGATHVRRLERQLVDDYVALVRRLLDEQASLGPDHVVRIAGLADMIRGYESVKLANVERYSIALDEALAAGQATGRA